MCFSPPKHLFFGPKKGYGLGGYTPSPFTDKIFGDTSADTQVQDEIDVGNNFFQIACNDWILSND